MRNEGSKLYSRQNLRRATVKNCWILTFSSLALFAITAPALGQSDGSIFVENGIRNPIEVSYALGGDTVRVTVSGKTTTRISPGPIQGGTEIALTLRRVDGDSAKRELPPAETKGRGTPVIGKSPIFIPIWTTVCTKRVRKTPERKALATPPPAKSIILIIL